MKREMILQNELNRSSKSVCVSMEVQYHPTLIQTDLEEIIHIYMSVYLKVNMTCISVYLKSLWLYLKRKVNVKAILLLNFFSLYAKTNRQPAGP